MKIYYFLLQAVVLLCFSGISYAQVDTVYFDPENSSDGSQDGTIEHPYSSFKSYTVPDNTVVYLKGGVLHEVDASLYIVDGVTNVTIASYGGGKAKLKIFTIRNSQNITIRNIEVENGGQWTKGFSVQSSSEDPEDWCSDITIDSVDIHGPADSTGTNNLYYGLIGQYITNFKLINSNIYHVNEDAIDMNHLYNAEFGNNHLYEINVSNKSGDGMQLSGDLIDLNIHDNIIDRSGSIEKFGIILGDMEEAENIKIESNEFIGPDQTSGGACIFYAAATPLPGIIRGNIFRDAPTGVWSHTDVAVGYNTFINNLAGIQILSGNMIVSNNDFYDNETAIYWSDDADTCNISNNIIYLTSSSQYGINPQLTHGAKNIQNMTGGYGGSDLATIADPLFVDISSENFNLQEGSPAIDSAIIVFKFDYDNKGKINHCNGTPDIGAYEYENNCPAVQNYAPVIVAPLDKTLVEKEKYILDLTNSYDQDDNFFYYYWDIPEIIDIVPYASDNSILALYAPEIDNDSVFEISTYITDGRLSSDTATITITVKVGTDNNPPVANAGEDKSATAGDLVEISGTASYDADGDNLTYIWSESTGGIALMNSRSETVSFYAPEVEESKGFTIELVVYDGTEMSAINAVSVTVAPGNPPVVNNAPIANAGEDKEATAGDLIELSGEDSYDPDGDDFMYFWSEGTGEVALMNVQKETVSFYAPQVTEAKEYTIELLVYDGTLMSTVDNVIVAVGPNPVYTLKETTGNQLYIYPTLVDESINIKNIESGTYSTEIISMDGRSIIKLDDLSSGNEINVASLKPGMYKLVIHGEETQTNFNFIKR